MTAQTQNTELQKVEEVTIHLQGQDYLALQAEKDSLQKRLDETLDMIASSADFSLKRSISYETQKAILLNHLAKMLDEHERNFDNGVEFSYEFASDYVAAATAAKHLGRKNDLIRFVEDWMRQQTTQIERDNNLFDNFKHIWK